MKRIDKVIVASVDRLVEQRKKLEGMQLPTGDEFWIKIPQVKQSVRGYLDVKVLARGTMAQIFCNIVGVEETSSYRLDTVRGYGMDAAAVLANAWRDRMQTF